MVPASESATWSSLPPEIIFQIIDAAAAQPDVSVALSLALVASWVRTRVDAFIYRTVVLGSASKICLFAQTVSVRPISFFTRHVRQLWIASTDGEDLGLTAEEIQCIEAILSKCTGVVDLTLDQGILMDDPAFPCRPKSLTIITSAFIFFLHFSYPMFERVTHLYLMNGQLHHAVVPSIAQLPLLTHLVISYCDHAGTDHVLMNTTELLRSSSLRCILFIPWTMSLPVSPGSNTGPSCRMKEELAKLNDPRVAVLPELIATREQFEEWKTYTLFCDQWWCSN